MDKLTLEKRMELLDKIGELIVEKRDTSLFIKSNIIKYITDNKGQLEQYKALSTLTEEQASILCELLDESIISTIYNFFLLFQENDEFMKLILIDEESGNEYDMLTEVTIDDIGSEICTYEGDVDGWIPRFSKLNKEL